MRLFGKIFGGFYALFGTTLSLLDVLNWVNIVKVFPQPPNASEAVYANIFVFFIGILKS